jgi:hypothetical protein
MSGAWNEPSRWFASWRIVSRIRVTALSGVCSAPVAAGCRLSACESADVVPAFESSFNSVDAEIYSIDSAMDQRHISVHAGEVTLQ